MQANKFSQEYPIYLKMKDYDVEVAQLALDEINARVDTAQVKAPFKGTLLSVFITPDRSVEAFKSVMVLADLSNLEVSADLTSTDLQKLQEGMAVTIVAVSGPAKELSGSIRKLPYPYGKADPAASQNEKQDTATRVSLNEDPATVNLALGDLVRVKVILEKRDATLWLPPQSIRKFEGRRFVVVQDSDTQRRVDVKIGITSDDRVEILEGLEEGQVVIAP
jgi:multidrug efflux pump subunit AcrA (membrane-fusion protein)